jgi:hypothetical protein
MTFRLVTWSSICDSGIKQVMTRNRKKVPTDIPAPDSAAPDSADLERANPSRARQAGADADGAAMALSLPPQVDPQERTIRCVICSTTTQAGSPDHMCWVCRRLKISAWREVEQQMPAQE